MVVDNEARETSSSTNERSPLRDAGSSRDKSQTTFTADAVRSLPQNVPTNTRRVSISSPDNRSIVQSRPQGQSTLCATSSSNGVRNHPQNPPDRTPRNSELTLNGSSASTSFRDIPADRRGDGESGARRRPIKLREKLPPPPVPPPPSPPPSSSWENDGYDKDLAEREARARKEEESASSTRKKDRAERAPHTVSRQLISYS